MSNVWYSLCGAYTLWLSMGLEGGLGIVLLVSTFHVESVVFLRRGSHFLAFYGAGGRLWDVLVGVNFRCRKCGILYAGLTLFLAFHGAGGSLSIEHLLLRTDY